MLLMHDISLLIHPIFPSKLNYDHVTAFWSTFISSNWIKSNISNSLQADQKWICQQIQSRDH